MILSMILLFVIGYAFIAMEHKIKIDKAAIALLMCGAIWTIFSLLGHDENITHELIDHLGDTCEILVFLIGAMTIVDLIDSHGGFGVITDHITTHNKHKLLWLLALITFFMSAALDNMTTTIIMVMLLRRIIANRKERWLFASVIVIAANSGGTWSPIGDVTTIMLWMRGNVTSGALMGSLFLPALTSTVIPTAIAARYIARKSTTPMAATASESRLPKGVGPRLSKFILVVGILSLLFVPVFKSITHLPPYMGMMISLGVMWVLTEIIYDKKRGIEESIKNRVSKVLKHIDMPTILFFLGILMSVAALQSAGVLTDVAQFLDRNIHEVFTITGIIGVLSSVIDNVPLVAACMGMYPVADAAAVASSIDPSYLQSFVQDGLFWHLLAYCAGVGGSILIIGSAAGVVAMGLEKITFSWYFKRIALLAVAGYFGGMAVIFLEHLLFGL
ncbi:sodium:proton antiporter NhaD [uncultured Alistipes sp.]|uniref:sodium:proton antiporter NhaD n=1 Tax=uncultured Alistipes sp. TaxID=538949 RepID=UPI0028046579|nr:sodium:proton antiporter NhaD [uncultured Alistipes sp.]